jgi:hypothetical protein
MFSSDSQRILGVNSADPHSGKYHWMTSCNTGICITI